MSTLTTPPGTSDVAIASASSIAASGRSSDASTTQALPPTITGATRETMPSSGGSAGATTPTTPVGSGSVKLKYGPATGFDAPSTCASLSAHPAYQTTRSIERSTSSRPVRQLRELRGTRLDHLREPVEHLAPVVRRRARPLRERGPRRAYRIAHVLPRRPRDVLPLRLVRAPRLAAREGAADEELVRLADRKPLRHPAAPA